MKILFVSTCLAFFSLCTVGESARAADLYRLSSVQRVTHFERFLREHPHLIPKSAAQHVRLFRAYFEAQRPEYEVHGAEYISELVDLFLRRQGAFRQTEALAWLGDQLSARMNKARVNRVAAHPGVLRLYADAAVLFSAGPISRRLSGPVGIGFLNERWGDELDAWAYTAWRNRELKAFIVNLAERVPGSPTSHVARARWFFELYRDPGCGHDLVGPAGE